MTRSNTINEEPDYEFVLFIDEAGDPGLKAVSPIDKNGASEWLTIGGVLFRKRYEQNVVDWVRDIRNRLNAKQGPALHFRNLSANKKIEACKLVAELPIRAICIASNKRNMKGHQNPRAAKVPSQEWFYNWCLRLLLERATAIVHRQSIKEFGLPKRMKIILAERGGHNYSQTAAYIYKIQQQARSDTTLLKRRQIEPDTLDWKLIIPLSSNSSAGAQLADVVSSAFYTAVRRSGTTAPFSSPAKELRPIMAAENGRVDDFGLVLQPLPSVAQLTSEQKEIFGFYGYRL